MLRGADGGIDVTDPWQRPFALLRDSRCLAIVRRRMLGWLLLLTAAWRIVLAARTPVPAEDGVSYLWMAERFAAFDAPAALALVFPPGLPLLCTPLLWLGVPAVLAGQTVGIVCATATVWPLAAIVRRVAPDAVAAVLLLWATASLLARNAAEVYSEPPFLLAMALGTLAGVRQRWWQMGGWAAAAFWIRPEGLLLAGAFALADGRRAWWSLLPAAGGVVALAIARWLAGHGFDPLPIHGFHELRDDLPQRGDLFANALEVPAAWFEAFGPLGLLPLFALLRRGAPRPGALVWQIVLQVAVVCTFVVRRRFFLSCAIPVFAMCGLALQPLRPRWRRTIVGALAAFGLVHGWTGVIAPDRLAERRIGEFLGARLAAGETVTGDLTRIVWFAGRAPLPPRRFDPDRLVAMAQAPDVRFVALGSRRPGHDELVARLADSYAPLALPDDLAALAAARGVTVLARR